MKVIIHAKGLTLKKEEDEYIIAKMEKISTLAKRIKDESSEIKIDISHDVTKAKEESITCVIKVFVPKDTLVSEANGSIVTEALDLAKKQLIPQIEKYKTKFLNH